MLAGTVSSRQVCTALRPTGLHRAGALLIVAGALGALATLGSAQSAAADVPVGPDDDRGAVRELQRAVAAPDSLSYSGTSLVTAWGPDGAVSVTVEMHHVIGQGTTVRVRGDDAPSVATFIGEESSESCCLRGLEGRSLARLVDNFSIAADGTEDVAGRAASIISASRDGAVSARLWVDRRSGLLLRSEIYGRDGRLARSGAFLDVRVQRHAFLEHLPPMLAAPDAVAMPMAAIPRLEAAGFRCPRRLPGGFGLIDVDRMRDGLGTLHTTYSDGLSTVSVFQQRGSLDVDSLTGFEPHLVDGRDVLVRYGLPTYVSWAGDGIVYTVVTDAPASWVHDIVGAYPARRAEDSGGFWGRLWRGLGRLAATASPLAMRA